ncbi:MAG: fasciclin domain-containing protein, partial [Flavobacteriales bacterium]|nr:fasciclin domain-containing protein [Flavobacteriales bacterium]
MKRLSTLFLALICSAAVLTSCNNEPADQPATSKPAKSDPAASNGNQETRNYEPAFTEEERAARIARKEAIAREAEENRQNNPVLKEEYNLNSTYRYIDTAPEFSMFAKLIRASDMAKQMHGTQITLFAADDEAFAKVDQGMLHKLTDPDNKKALNDFIRASMCTH